MTGCKRGQKKKKKFERRRKKENKSSQKSNKKKKKEGGFWEVVNHRRGEGKVGNTSRGGSLGVR